MGDANLNVSLLMRGIAFLSYNGVENGSEQDCHKNRIKMNFHTSTETNSL